MKNLFYAIFTVVFSAIIINSCKKNNDIEESKLIQMKFKDFEEVAKIHSKTLGFVLEDIKAKKIMTKSTVSEISSTEIEEITIKSFQKALNEDQLIKRINQKYNIALSILTKSGDDINGDGTSDEIYLLLEDSFDNVSQMQSPDSIRSELISVLSAPSFSTTFTVDEQDLIIFSFALYIDSFEYWGENLDAWNAMIGLNVPMSPAERDMYRRSAQNRYARADAEGAAVGIFGSLLYKVSPYSALAAWVYGAISASVIAACD